MLFSSNASKQTREPGSIRRWYRRHLRIGPKQHLSVDALLRIANEIEERLTVAGCRWRDAGIDVDPRAVDKLFDAFYTTKATGWGFPAIQKTSPTQHRR